MVNNIFRGQEVNSIQHNRSPKAETFIQNKDFKCVLRDDLSASYLAPGEAQVMDVRIKKSTKCWVQLISASLGEHPRGADTLTLALLDRRNRKCSHFFLKPALHNIFRKVRYRQTLPLEMHSFSWHQGGSGTHQKLCFVALHLLICHVLRSTICSLTEDVIYLGWWKVEECSGPAVQSRLADLTTTLYKVAGSTQFCKHTSTTDHTHKTEGSVSCG